MPYALIINGNQITITEGNYPQLSIGLDSEKSSSPSIGNMHIAMDSGKTYTCYVTGYWSISNSSTRARYDNHLGTTDNVMSVIASVGTGTTDTANHLMVLESGVGSIVQRAAYKANLVVYPALESIVMNWKVTGIIAGTGGTKKTVVGLTVSESDHAGINFQCDDAGQWITYVSDGFAVQQTDISAVVDGDILTIQTNGLRVIFLVNGVVVSSYLTGFAPTSYLYPFAIVTASGYPTVARGISIDYIGFEGMK